jgi:hypothetical protein
MATADALMLTGVVRHCGDCGGERIFVEPDEDSADEFAAGTLFACMDCGAALFIDPAIFASSGIDSAERPAADKPDERPVQQAV